MASALEKERFDASSNDEKLAEGARGIDHVDPNSDVADPDAGLSEEERAAAVCHCPMTRKLCANQHCRTASFSGNSTSNSSHGFPFFTLFPSSIGRTSVSDNVQVSVILRLGRHNSRTCAVILL